QAGATTGRLASTNPNMQNVPVRTELGREIRGCFEAEAPHVLISADYSQVELRVLAHVAEEPVLKEIFVRGEDVHTATGSRVFGKPAGELTPMDRSKSKMINYGIVYGLSDYGLADRLNIPREEAKQFIDAYLERFPRVAAFVEETIARARERGHVQTLWNRRRQIPELQARNYQVRTLGERLAVNTVALVLVAVVLRGGLASLGHVGRVPWWALVGGLFGAVYVFVALEAVRTLGVSGLTAVVIAGQLTISVVIDRFGLLGVAKQQIGLTRIVGLVLLAAGVVLVVRK